MKLYPKNVAGRIFLLLCTVFLLFVIVILSVPIYNYLRYSPQEGDLVFQSLPRGPLVNAIEGITHSKYSHCGIVVRKDGKWIVLEAVGPVKETGLLTWIYQGRECDFEAYRLNSEYDAKIDLFISEGYTYLGLPYDIRYRMDDEKIYCSELIYKAFKKAVGEEIADLETLGSLDWKPYRKTIETFEEGPVPLDRYMITPANIAKSDKLKKVY